MTRSTLTRALALLAPFVLFAPCARALSPSFPGSIDPTYGTNGVLAFGVRSGYENPYVIAATPDGKWLVSGGAQDSGGAGNIRYLLRLTGEGRIDTTFGAQGFVYDNYASRVLAVQPTGKILAAATTAAGGFTKAMLRRLLPDGSDDAAFGTAAGSTVLDTATTATPWQSISHFEIDGQGRILAGSSLLATDLSIQRGEVWRFSADGVPDVLFGTQGRVTLDDVAPYVQVMRVREQADGKSVIVAWCQASRSATIRACIIRLNASGTRDATFGPNGVRDFAPPPNTSYPIYDLRIAADGKIYVAGTNFSSQPPKAIVFRLNADGTPDAGYGAGGIAALTFTGQTAYASTIRLLPDGRQLVVGSVVGASGPDGYGYVARLSASGQLDATFGAGGIGPVASAAVHSFEDGAILADGNILVIGRRYNTAGTSTDIDTMLARYIGVEITTNVVEFFNSTLNHYFITADPNEAAAIDGGAAGPGWSRTGQSWKSGGPNRVCRFYGSPDINPATGTRRGPNSHFYTIEAAECAAVKQDPGWRFESYDFNGWPVAAGACPAGTVAVKRAYNNRFAQNDSNHRYMISDAIYNQMVGLGWTGEGTVFCAPL